MSYSCKSISSGHRDLIHDVAFNWYGTSFATCSSDQTVRVWNMSSTSKDWFCSAEWKCHAGSVWRVTWAHPEFGQVLATCSFDRTASIWEEMPGEGPTSGVKAATTNGHQNKNKETLSHWVKRTTLVDSRTAVTDVKFAPSAMGLILAACSSQGIVRIYDANDVMNLSQWSLQYEIQCNVPASCLSWNTIIDKNHPPMIAVGSDDVNSMISSISTSHDLTNTTTVTGSNSGTSVANSNNNNSQSGSSSSKERVLIYQYVEQLRKWIKVESILSGSTENSNVFEPVHDVSFAPNAGRSYSLLAVATTKDLRIITIKPTSSQLYANNRSNRDRSVNGSIGGESNNTVSDGGGDYNSSHKYEIKLAGKFTDHASAVWRVCWNVTGTILASSADDGRIRLWKSSQFKWSCIASLRGDGLGGQLASHISNTSTPESHRVSGAAIAIKPNESGIRV